MEVVITGSTGEIGGALALQIAQELVAKVPSGVRLHLPVRNVEKGQQLARRIAKATGIEGVAKVYQVNLDSKSSVKAFAEDLKQNVDNIYALVNNAAITMDEKVVTNDGMELMFQVNVFAYFQLMELLRPLLRDYALNSSGEKARIINVASEYAGELDLDDLNFDKRSFDSTAAYKQSKQANRLMSWAAARLYEPESIVVHACHPGVVNSNLLAGLGFGGFGGDKPDDGARTPAFLTVAPEPGKITGKYWRRSRSGGSLHPWKDTMIGVFDCKWSKDTGLQQGLWARLQELLSQ